MQETGNIAHSLVLGKGFSDVFGQGTGATAWLTPVYPLLLAGIFRIFGIFTVKAFIAAAALNITCGRHLRASFLCWPKIASVGVGAAAAWFWAIFPNAIMIPYEWIWDTSLTVLLAALILWFTSSSRNRSVRDWCLYGLLWGFVLMTNPALASLLPFLLRMGRYTRPASACDEAWHSSRWRFRWWWFAACLGPCATMSPSIASAAGRSTFPFALWLGHNLAFDPFSRDHAGDSL